jgi:hypothetical protein
MSENTQALATVEQNAALAAYAATGMEGLVGDGYTAKISTVELLQMKAAESGLTPGQFRDKQSNEISTSLKLIPLEFRDGRVFWPDGELGSDPLCRSDNGKFPVLNDRIVRQDGGKGCKGCPKSQWKQIRGQNGKVVKVRPECNETMSLLFLNAETGMPHRMNGKGTNVPVLKDFRDTLFKKVMGAKMKGEILPHFGLVAELTSTKIVGKKGTYFIYNFSPAEKLDEENSNVDVNFAFTMYDKLVLKKGAVYEDEGETVTTGETAVNQVVDQEYVEG